MRKLDKQCGIACMGGDFMESEKMSAIDRTLLFLAKATYENHGAGVEARIVPMGKDSQGT